MLKILPPYLLAAGILTPPFIMASTPAPEAETEGPQRQYGPPLTGFQTYRADISASQSHTGPVITVSQPAAPQFTQQPPPTAVVAVPQPMPVPPPPLSTAVAEPTLSIRPVEAELPTLPATQLPDLPSEIPVFSGDALPPPTSAVPVSTNAAALPPPPTLPEPPPAVETAEPVDISVLVAVIPEVTVGSTGPLLLQHSATGENIEISTQALALQASGDQLLIDGVLHDELLISALPGETVFAGDSSYRGELLVRAEAGQLYLINTLTIDEFLYSQVSALLTHAPAIRDPAPYAIAARTAALQARQTPTDLWYDLDATQFDYFGADAETPIGIAAVETTRGQVIQPDAPTLLAHNG
ncbi:MAG: SpoIID/LytB domain-containing protein [Cyanobacteria bacterium J06629_9]